MFLNFNTADNASANLDAGINASTGTITVTLGEWAVFPADNSILTLVQYNTPADPTSWVLKFEKVLMTSRSGDILTVTRGYDGTTGTTFLSGDFVYLNVVSKVIEDIQDEVVRLEDDKLNKVGGLRTGLTASSVLENNWSGAETARTISSSPTIVSTALITSIDATTRERVETPFSYITNLMTSLTQSYFGDWSDGDSVIWTNSTLSRDMYYRNLTINSGITLDPNWYAIYVLGTLTNNWKIARNGITGNAGANSANADALWWVATASLNTGTCWVSWGGAAGWTGKSATGDAWSNWVSPDPSYATTGTIWKNWGTGWIGGRWVWGTGWIWWTATQWILSNILYNVSRVIINLMSPSRWLWFPAVWTQYLGMPTSGGGGGGRWDGTGGSYGGGGGSAGSNWGIMFIYAFNIAGTWTIEWKWGIGWAGWNAYWYSTYYGWGGGGGGGGNWGILVLVYSNGTVWTCTMTGWVGGTGWLPYGSGTVWATGQTGTTGQVITIVV